MRRQAESDILTLGWNYADDLSHNHAHWRREGLICGSACGRNDIDNPMTVN